MTILGCHVIDPYLKVEKGDNKIRGHWFWNGDLLHIVTWDSGIFLAQPKFFLWQKRIAFKCSLDQWPAFLCLLGSLDQPRYGSESHTQPSQDTHPGWYLGLTMLSPMVSCKFCYQETFCLFIYGDRVYIQMYLMQI